MAKTVKVEGRLISVPDDATPDEIDQIANPIPKNPSDAIPKAKAPVPTELQGPAPSRFKQVMTNLPGSVVSSGERFLRGPSMGEGDYQGQIDLNAGLHPLINAVKQRSFQPLIDAATEDPVSAVQNVQGLFHGGKDIGENTAAVPILKSAVTGGARAAMEPSGFSRFSPVPLPKSVVGGVEGYYAGRHFGSPILGAAAGAALPIIKGAWEGASEAARNARNPEPNPFNLPKERTMPSSGGRPFSPQDTGIEGGNVNQNYKAPLPVEEENNFGKYKEVTPRNNGGVAVEPHPTNIEGGVAPAKQLELDIKNPFEIKHERSMPSSGGYNPGIDKVREVGRGPSNPATVPNAATETRPVQSPTGASAQVPETPANAPASFSSSYKPVSRKVIMDEQGKPVAYEDPKNPYTGPGTVVDTSEPDIHDQIAGEGVDKRAADSRAKYEDVYQNVIKGNYTPEQLRATLADPVAKAALDYKVKNYKRYPPDHPTMAGRSRYKEINPLVVDSLARRLESEPQ